MATRDWTRRGAILVRPRAVVVTYIILLALYAVAIHPWLMTWDATEGEQRLALPGDSLAASPDSSFTRAITINAPADRIWPWLVQIGQDRAGFYSNDWLENIIAANIHNADTIHPEWQRRQVGDVVRLIPDSYLAGLAGRLIAGQSGAAVGPRIWLLEPPRVIADSPGRFVLVPIDEHSTRLLFRESLAANTPPGGVFGAAVGRLAWDPVHFVMVQRMLRGIKERAEGLPLVPPILDQVAHFGWALAGVFLVGFFLGRRRGALWLPIPLAATLPALVLASDVNAALAAFLAVGITIAGAVAFGRRWWSAYALIVAGVLLVLVLAPDAYAAFGLIFMLSFLIALVIRVSRGLAASSKRRQRLPV
ncbi:MAG TPA: hypothetical protein VFT99_10865 [Roseiflexaceae bacterium]|nr:hypothetical protein [Roseiflexaceae bacterium]